MPYRLAKRSLAGKPAAPLGQNPAPVAGKTCRTAGTGQRQAIPVAACPNKSGKPVEGCQSPVEAIESYWAPAPCKRPKMALYGLLSGCVFRAASLQVRPTEHRRASHRPERRSLSGRRSTSRTCWHSPAALGCPGNCCSFGKARASMPLTDPANVPSGKSLRQAHIRPVFPCEPGPRKLRPWMRMVP